MEISESLRKRLKNAIEIYEQSYGSMCWGNGRSNIKQLPNELDGMLLDEIIKIIQEETK